VLPEADRFLHVLLFALIIRRLPRPTTAIVMRPPQSVRGRLRGRLGSLAKTLLILALTPWKSVDVHLLEDPLAEGDNRVWRDPILRRERFRLDDPCSLLETSPGELPEELRLRSSERPFLTVVGSIDDRKNLPLTLAAWRSATELAGFDLVVAGKQSPSVSTWLQSAGPFTSNIYFVNRYLSDAEIRGVIEYSRGIVALYDGGFSSGFLVAAAAMGRWAITIEGSRTGTVAAQQGFGVLCTPTLAGVADAMRQALVNGSRPPQVAVPSSREFGRRILRRSIEAEAAL
jgi:hypothetical protein